MNKLELVMDGRNGISDELRNTAMKEFAAVYFKVNSHTNILFLRVGEGDSNFVHFVNNNLYNYEMEKETTLGEIIEQIHSNYKFDDINLSGRNSYMRIFPTSQSLQIFIMNETGNDRLFSFAESELEILKKKIAKTIPSEEETDEFNSFQNALNLNVLQVLSVFISQHHTAKSLSFVMSSVDAALRAFPLSEIDVDDEWIKDESSSDEEVTCYFNKRCTNVVKRVVTTVDEDGTTNENITYVNTTATLFTSDKEDEDEEKYYFNEELSSETITLPWKFELTKIQRLPKEDLTKENGFIEFKI